jgi:hypothetical protein
VFGGIKVAYIRVEQDVLNASTFGIVVRSSALSQSHILKAEA